jgi:hypothetical protein
MHLNDGRTIFILEAFAFGNYVSLVIFQTLQFLGNPPEASSGIITATADAGFVSMIRTGMLALQLLPPNSAAGLVVVTGESAASSYLYQLTGCRLS